MDVKILSAADTHVGCRQYGLRAREADIEKSFEQLVNKTKNYDALTISGDIIDSTRPLPRTVEFLKRMHRRLVQMEKPCYVSIGNHDLTTPHWISILDQGSKYGFRLLDNSTADVNGVKIYGCSFTDKKTFNYGINIPDDTDLLLMHQSVTPFAGFPSKTSFEPEDFADVTAQIVVVGDIHVHKMFEVSGHQQRRIQVWSPGSTEVLGRSEEFSKYALEVNFRDGVLGQVVSVPLQTRKCMSASVMSAGALEALQNTLSNVDEEMLVFVEFSNDLDNVMPRLRSVVDLEKVILRPYPISKLVKSAKGKSVKATQVTMSDIAVEFFPQSPLLQQTGLQCLEIGADVPSLLDNLISSRREELASA